MPVDVITEIEIQKPCAEVAAFAADPSNAPSWYVNIREVDWRTPPPLSLKTKVAFVAQFLGKRLEYTYEIIEYAPKERLVMRTAQGPFPMETSYTWESLSPKCTRMTLRNRGEPRGFSKITAPIMVAAMRKANQKDLKALKVLLEEA